MTKIFFAVLLAIGCGAFADNMDSASTAPGATTAEPFKLIHVNDLATWMASKTEKVYIFDANNTKVRTSEGVIPGATILASSTKYEVASTLPQDKSSNLVFYCANTACSASHMAAKRATDAGYTNVSVMADGISGWVKAGKPVTKYKKS